MSRHNIIVIYLLLVALIPAGHAVAQETEIIKMDVSTPGNNELAPILRDSVLFFISNRRTNLLVTYMDQNEELLYRVLSAPLKSKGNTGPAKLFAPPGQPRFNAGPLTFSSNGATLIATHNLSNDYKHRKNSKKDNRLGLFTARKRNDAWHQFQQITLNASKSHSIGHPSLSRDGSMLFFVSDMEGGYGDTDIYVSHKHGDEWGEPKNLGPGINTAGKELFPFIHPSGKLYFSSDGHSTQGAFDLFHIEWVNSKAVPVPLPIPVNSEYNDYSCFIADDQKWGFFASDRSGDDDIYRFSLPQISCTDPQEVTEDNYCYTFFENGPFKTDTLPYIYRWDFGDGESAVGLEVDHCLPGPGKYAINLSVVDTLLNEELFSVASYNLDLEETNQIWFEDPDTISVGESIDLQASIRGFEGISKNLTFYWDFDSGDSRIGKDIVYTYHTSGKYMITCSTILNDNREVCFYRNIIVNDP